ncbi:hypothetical protein RFF05_04350 [Bengtsoniella intestinalis]|uniref:hypothetical protein n=1 Tax=Bengtsoniella intestinalis TaxID=3073143 RepID=UPI00391F29E3
MAKKKKIYINSVQFSYAGTDATFQYFLERLVEQHLTQGQICNVQTEEIVACVENQAS